MMLALVAFATFCSTYLGGVFALRLKDKLHLILGFSAGAVVGVSFFDLMPEAFELVEKHHSFAFASGVVALGFLLYLALDRILLMHGHVGEESGVHGMRGSAGAGTLSVHSFLDGIGIGLAFQVSPALGIVVTTAVLAHDFSDGINTINYVLKHGASKARALQWLLIDALAPVFGILTTLLFSVSESTLGVLLALFSGFFLYIGASDLIPESHHAHPRVLTTIMTLLGAGVLFVVVRLANI